MEHKPEVFAYSCVGSKFGTLLGPEETSACRVVFSGRPFPGLGRLTHSWLLVGVVVVGGLGVWWCVECCIVDASILLCLVLWFEVLLCC